ncbi:MAG TPA: autotransporter domain-containing protein [Xanthobacteraceae bacterium]|nr:autotransporter domain-containing protein [Xanthobacteraceae bacterium]
MCAAMRQAVRARRAHLRLLLASSSLGAMVIAGGTPAWAASCTHTITAGLDNAAGTVTNICVNHTSFAGSISNQGTIGPNGIDFVSGTISGQIQSTGNINFSSGVIDGGISLDAASKIATPNTAIDIINLATFAGGITNAGTITGGRDGINVHAYATTAGASVRMTFSGGISNSGTISGSAAGIEIGSSVGASSGSTVTIATFTGGITNSGTISAFHLPAIAVDPFAIANSSYTIGTFAGGIDNATSGTISGRISVGGTASGAHASVTISSFSGGITNSGTISGGVTVGGGAIGTGSSASILSFSGGISNAGTITGGGIWVGANSATETAFGIVGGSVSISDFSGGITNSGLVRAAANGIWVGGAATGASAVVTISTFAGGISNSATILAGGHGIFVGGSTKSGGTLTIATFLGGITNSGTVSGANGAIVVDLVTSFLGGINNSGLLEAPSHGGIAVSNASVVGTTSAGGGIVNGGTISAGTGIALNSVATFLGGMTNAGTIAGGNLGISATAVTTLAGGITNSGTISEAMRGILALDTLTFAGGISNGGTITAGNAGIIASHITQFGSSVAGGITNSGSVSSGAYGIGVMAVSSFSGGIGNSGVISAGGNGVYVFASSMFSGGISNAGTLSGSIALTLSGISTFTGGVSNSGTISGNSLAVYIINVETFNGVISNSGTIAGGIGIIVANSGPVAVFDSGTINATSGEAVALSASHTGSNSFTLGAGYSISGTVSGSGTDIFQLGGSSAGTFDLSAIGTQYTGFDAFNVVGGTWTVTGSTSENWTIAAGATLLIGNNSTALGPVLTDNGAFGFAQSGTYTFGGVITGSGTVEQLGPGTTVLTGTNSYSGGTVVNGGTLQLAGAGTLGAASGTTTVNTGGTLDLGGTTQTQASVNLAGGTLQNGSLDAPINSTGGVINGIGGTASLTATAGSTIVQGSNNYSGPTNVDGGTLEVLGAITGTSSVAVSSGGVLSGTGTIDPFAVTIAAGGTLAPGTSAAPFGTLGITGNLVFNPGGVYAITIASNGSNSRTAVVGSADLGGNGTVNLTFQPGHYASGTVYQILTTTTGVSGTFAGLTVNGAFAGTIALDYTTDPGDVDLDVAGSSLFAVPAGATANQQNALNGINASLIAGNTLPAGFSNLSNLSTPGLLNALSQLSGEPATDADKGAFHLMSDFLQLMLDPAAAAGGSASGNAANGFAPTQDATLAPDVALAYAKALKAPQPQAPASFDQRWTSWASAFGGTSFLDGNAALGSNNVTASDYGFAAGSEYHGTPDTAYGFGLAGGGTNWNLAQGLGGGRSDAFQAGVYAKSHLGPAYLSGALAFANHWFTTNRTVVGDQLRATFTGQSYAARGEIGYRYGVPITGAIIGVRPYAALQAQDFRTPGYSETDLTGGGFGLTYASMNARDTRSELGARFDDLQVIGGMPLVLRGRVAWAHDWVSNPALGAVFQALPGSRFTVNGASPPKNSALTTAAAELHIGSGWTAIAKFDGEFAAGSQSYGGTGTLRYSW